MVDDVKMEADVADMTARSFPMKRPEIIELAVAQIHVLPDLEKYLPVIDLMAQERLSADIHENGIREPLVVADFEGGTIVLDGHHRLAIARQLRFDTVPVVCHHVEDLIDAKLFMVNNQFGKRNLGLAERVLLALKVEPQLTAAARARMKMTKSEIVQNSVQSAGRVVEKIAAMAGTSRDTVQKVKSILASENEKLLAVVKTSLSIDAAAKIAALPPEDQDAAIEAALTRKKTQVVLNLKQPLINGGSGEISKISESCYLEQVDERNFAIAGIRDVAGEPKPYAVVVVRDGLAEILESGAPNPRFIGPLMDETAYNENIDFYTAVLDNMRMAHKMLKPVRRKAQKEYAQDKMEQQIAADKAKVLTEKLAEKEAQIFLTVATDNRKRKVGPRVTKKKNSGGEAGGGTPQELGARMRIRP